MIWALLAAVGVPLWLCAVGIVTLVARNRALRRRPGNIAVRLRRPGKRRWSPGHAVWIHDVLAFRGFPAAWKEELSWVSDAAWRPASDDEKRKLRRIGERPIVATLTCVDVGTIDVAARAGDQADLLGPFASAAGSPPVTAGTAA